MAQSNNTLRTQILLRSDTTANWSKLDVDYKGGNAVLGKAEIGVELTGSIPKIKIGDGVTAWKDLPYFGDDINAAIQSQLDALETRFDDHYTKTEIDNIRDDLQSEITLIPKFSIEVAEANTDGTPNVTDPQTSVIYIVPNTDISNSDMYTEWLYVRTESGNTWEMLGKQKLDLSDYATKDEVNETVQSITSNHNNLATIVQGLVDADFTTQIASAKSEAVSEAANNVPIQGVSSEFDLTDKIISIKSINVDKVEGLPEALSNRYTKDDIDSKLSDFYTKTETLQQISDTIKQLNGGESAAAVLAELNAHKQASEDALRVIETNISTISSQIENVNTELNTLKTADINVNRLTQDPNSYLILDGGDSTSFI